MKKAIGILVIAISLAIVIASVRKGMIALPYPWNMLPTIVGLQVVAFFGAFYWFIARRSKRVKKG